jgi:hypothetical protein
MLRRRRAIGVGLPVSCMASKVRQLFIRDSSAGIGTTDYARCRIASVVSYTDPQLIFAVFGTFVGVTMLSVSLLSQCRMLS